MADFTERLEIPIPLLGDTEWRGLYVEAFEIIDDLLGRIAQAGGLTFVRRISAAGVWPERGDVPSGASVIWVKLDASNPDPDAGGAFLQPDHDLLVIAES